jgi:PhzF family phenazine biosynthesis protein
MPSLRFKQVDVFSAQPFRGNPVAVVLGADDLSPEQMQRIAAWTNLSETTFVLEPTIPGPAYRLRIFTPVQELPFAGHPTVGSCHAVLEEGIVEPEDGGLVQECLAGSLPLRVVGDGVERWIHLLETPEAEPLGDHPELSGSVSAALGRPIAATPPPSAFRNGPTWLFARLESEADLTALDPDASAVVALSREHSLTGIAAFAFADGGGVAVRLRCFAPAFGVPEDPVTGSANAALPACLVRHGLIERTGRAYTASQGTELGRDGRIRVRVLDDAGRTAIGGQAVTVLDGEMRVG